MKWLQSNFRPLFDAIDASGFSLEQRLMFLFYHAVDHQAPHSGISHRTGSSGLSEKRIEIFPHRFDTNPSSRTYSYQNHHSNNGVGWAGICLSPYRVQLHAYKYTIFVRCFIISPQYPLQRHLRLPYLYNIRAYSWS